MADQLVYVNLDLNGQQIKNVRAEALASAPFAVAGRMYYNTTTGLFGVYDGVAAEWKYIGTGGGISTTLPSGNILVGNASNIATAVAASGEASISNTGEITLSNAAVIGKVITGFSSAPGTVAATDTILQAIQKLDGNVSALDSEIGNKQPLDATLTSLAGLDSSAGYLVQTAADTFAKRTLTGTTNQVSITNSDGTTGNPVFSLPQNINSTANPTFGGLVLNGDIDFSGSTGVSFELPTAIATSLEHYEGADSYLVHNTISKTTTLGQEVIISGDLTVNGTTTFVNSANLDVADKNITVNVGGSTASATGAGINIEGDSAAVVGYFRSGAGDNSILELKSPTGSELTLDINANKTLTVNGSLTITADASISNANTGDQIAGNGLSGTSTLAVNVDDSTIEINADALRVKDSGITNAKLAGGITYNKLANSYVANFVSGDFTAGVLTISAATHGLGASADLEVVVKNSASVNVTSGVIVTTAGSGDVTVTVNAGLEFNGRILIKRIA